MYHKKNFLLLVFVIFLEETLASWPPKTTTCPASDDLEKYSRCAVKVLRELTPELPRGIKEANLPPLDPLSWDTLIMSYNFPNFRINANMTNLRIEGACNYVLHDLFVDPGNLTLKFSASMPYVESQADYDVKGKLLILPITSTGHFHGNFSHTKFNATAVGREYVDEHNVKRIGLKSISVKLRVGGGKIRMNTPPKFKTIAQAVTNLFNSNPRLILNILTPFFERGSAEIARSLLERALKTFTKDELVP